MELPKLNLSASAGGVEELTCESYAFIKECLAIHMVPCIELTNWNRLMNDIDHLRASLGAAQGEIARREQYDIEHQMDVLVPHERHEELLAALSAQAAAEAEVESIRSQLYQERQYHAYSIKQLKTTSSEMISTANARAEAAEQRAAGMESATIERCAKALDDVQPHCAAIIRALSQPHGEANG